MLYQEQYRFLRFLLELVGAADGLEGDPDAEEREPRTAGDAGVDSTLQRAMARMRVAVWLFERSHDSRAGGAAE